MQQVTQSFLGVGGQDLCTISPGQECTNHNVIPAANPFLRFASHYGQSPTLKALKLTMPDSFAAGFASPRVTTLPV